MCMFFKDFLATQISWCYKWRRNEKEFFNSQFILKEQCIPFVKNIILCVRITGLFLFLVTGFKNTELRGLDVTLSY